MWIFVEHNTKDKHEVMWHRGKKDNYEVRLDSSLYSFQIVFKKFLSQLQKNEQLAEFFTKIQLRKRGRTKLGVFTRG